MESKGAKPGAKWQQILDEFVVKIRTGALPVGSRIAPEADIAVQYGVSRPTANRAMNELAKLGFVARKPKIGTVVLEARPRARHLVAVIADRVASHLDFPQSEFINGIQEVLGEDYSLVLFDSQGDPANEIRHIRKAAATTDGIILYPTCDPRSNGAIETVYKSGFPLVMVDRVPAGEVLPAVIPNEESATREAVEHMISRGNERIAFLSFDKPEVPSISKRYTAYAETLADHGLKPIERFMPRELEISDAARVSYLRDVFFSLFKGPEQVTGFFCVQDTIALGILEACGSFSVECPGEVEIGCFNEWPAILLARPWDIHRIVRSKRTMGKVAAEKVLAQIHHVPFEMESHIGATLFVAEPGPSAGSAVGMSDWILNSLGR